MLASDLMVLFGMQVRKARRQAGLSQGQLADRAGFSQQYISMIEAGRQNVVTLETAARIAAVVECDVWRLLSPRRLPPGTPLPL